MSCINFLPPPLSHIFYWRERVINLSAVSTCKATDLYIKSTTLVRHSLLSVNTSARLLKGACPLSLTLGLFFLEPFLYVNFHIVVNWFPYLSIANRGVASTYSPVDLGLQIFDLTTLLLVINYAFLGWAKSSKFWWGQCTLVICAISRMFGNDCQP